MLARRDWEANINQDKGELLIIWEYQLLCLYLYILYVHKCLLPSNRSMHRAIKHTDAVWMIFCV